MEGTSVYSAWKGFIFRHLDHFAGLCCPPGPCRPFAVTCDQNHLSGLRAQRHADTCSSKELFRFLPNHCRSFRELMGRGSGSWNWGREGFFIRIHEQPKIEKEKNQNHQFVYSLLEEHRVPASITLWKESRRGQTNLLSCSDQKEDGT